MKGLILLADFFEDTEAIASIDVLKRAGLEVDLVSMTGSLELKTSYNLTLKADKLADELQLNDYEFLIIPGGGRAVNTLHDMENVSDIIKHFNNKGKVIGAICAGPSLITKLGLLEGKEFTCYPSFEKYAISGTYVNNKNVLVSDNFITAKSMAYSIEFGLAIIEKLLGKATKEKVYKAIHGIVE